MVAENTFFDEVNFQNFLYEAGITMGCLCFVGSFMAFSSVSHRIKFCYFPVKYLLAQSNFDLFYIQLGLMSFLMSGFLFAVGGTLYMIGKDLENSADNYCPKPPSPMTAANTT